MNLSGYQKMIVEATGCHIEDAQFIEENMRDYIVGGPLDGLSRIEFGKAARRAMVFMSENTLEVL